MPIACSTHRPLSLALCAMLLCIPVAERPAHVQNAAEPPVRVGDDPAAVRKAKHDLIFREARAEARERAERVAEARRALKLKAHGKKGARAQPALPEDRESTGQPPVRVALPLGVSSVNAIPTN